MPGARIAVHKLPDLARARDEELRRYLQAAYHLVVRMGVPVELVGEQLLDRTRAVLARGQADGVHDDQIDQRLGRALAKVGRGQVAGLLQPAALPGPGRGLGGLRLWIRTRHGRLDRKSTRLNSSHLVISYAVFCLKKK